GDNVLTVLLKQLREPVPTVTEWRPDLPAAAAIDDIIQRATAKAPADRYSTATEMLHVYSSIFHPTQTPFMLEDETETRQIPQSQPINVSIPTDITPPRPITQPDSNRKRLLAKVEQFWVKGVLENSLSGTTLLELGIKPMPDAVDRGWDMILQQPQSMQSSHLPVPAGIKMIEVFDALNGELLILGDPGAGKTTALLALARDLIGRARRDDSLPIPVVFNLAAWSEKQPPLRDWLVDELNARYQVPRQIGIDWVDHDVILPLLDGLDEVVVTGRNGCVDAINLFRADHGLHPIVVCSRIADYTALARRLKLSGAIVLQPLTIEAVYAYLDEVGEAFAGVRELLEDDEKLRRLVISPLMLNIVLLSYQGVESESGQVIRFDTLPERRYHLFEKYIEQMLIRRGKPTRYSTEQTRHYMSRLAMYMSDQAQSVFYIENLQSDMLSSPFLRHFYRLVGVPVGLLVALPMGLIAGAGVGYSVGVMAGVTSAALAAGLVIGTVVSFTIGLMYGLAHWREDQVYPADLLNFTWEWKRIIGGVLAGSVVGLIGLAIAGRSGGVAILIPAVLISVLALSLKTGTEVEKRVFPNQGIWSVIRNVARFAAVATFPVSFSGWLILGLSGYLAVPALEGLFWALFAGLLISITLGLAFGGIESLVKHMGLRLLLVINGDAPVNYRDFLDYCASLILFRKVGGGYTFLHRLLLEHLT
ncbi:MAG TPA: hypothetical protein VHL11_03345, partial [Phototrophicaceae bacterium]|nr:hypothetical protein [Phototrophicaceae bacterium]